FHRAPRHSGVRAYVQALIVPLIPAVEVIVRDQILFPCEVGVAHPMRNVGDPRLAAHVNDPSIESGQVTRLLPKARIVAECEIGRTVPWLIPGSHPGARRIIGDGVPSGRATVVVGGYLLMRKRCAIAPGGTIHE